MRNYLLTVTAGLLFGLVSAEILVRIGSGRYRKLYHLK